MIEGLVLGLHLVSAHSPDNPQFNDRNYGIYARTAEGWVAGALKNSWNRWSLYGGKYLGTRLGGGAEMGALFGAATGYRKRKVETPCDKVNAMLGTTYNDGKCFLHEGSSRGVLAPLVALSASHGGLRLSYVPKYKGKSAVYHLSIEHQF